MKNLFYKFGSYTAVLLVFFAFGFVERAHAVSGYIRTPSGSSVSSGSNVEIQFSYDGTDSTGFARTGVALFSDTGSMVACHHPTNVVSGVGGSIDETFTGLSDGQFYHVYWGKISSVAPSFNLCGGGSTLSYWNSTVDGNADLESGTPAFTIESGGGGEGSTTTDIATTTDYATGLAPFFPFLAVFLWLAVFSFVFYIVRIFT